MVTGLPKRDQESRARSPAGARGMESAFSDEEALFRGSSGEGASPLWGASFASIRLTTLALGLPARRLTQLNAVWLHKTRPSRIIGSPQKENRGRGLTQMG